MNALSKILLTAIVIAAGLRAAAAFMFMSWDFPKRTAVYFIEPQMVHLARCVQLGESLYPEWKVFPYIANIYTPAYFWCVGVIGRAAGADLDKTMRIGRGVTICFLLLGAAVVGWIVRTNGRLATAAAFSFSIGSVLMMGFGGMVRPDVMADVIGFIGFLAATSSVSIFTSGLILAAACLCKQSALFYVVAAMFASLWIGDKRRALLIPSVAAMIALIVLGATYFLGERNVFSSVLLEAGSPWRWDQWCAISAKFLARSGDVILLCTIGVVQWCLALRRGDAKVAKDSKRWLSLFAAASGFGLLGIAKVGSDLNYFLPLRYLSAVALAEQLARHAAKPPSFKSLIGATAVVAALAFWSLPWWSAIRTHDAFNSTRKTMARIYQSEIDGIARMAKTQRVFTNCDDAALRIQNPFLDVYAFRVMVDGGRVQPTVLAAKLAGGEYDLIATTGPLEDPGYRDSAFALPLELTQAILQRYEKYSQGALVYYRPK